MSQSSHPYNNMSGSKVTTVNTRTLQALIVEQRVQGEGFPQIAYKLGLSLPYTYKLYKKALKAAIQEPVKQIIKLEAEKLERLEQRLYQIMDTVHLVYSGGRLLKEYVVDKDGKHLLDADGQQVFRTFEDPSPKLAAIGMALKVMERRARLFGLDKPSKTALTDPSGSFEASHTLFYLPSNNREEAPIDVIPESKIISSD